MKTLPCSACGIVGYSEGAHVLGNGGMSRKADADTQAPLCGPHMEAHVLPSWPHSLNIGCHRMFDEHRDEFDREFPDYNPAEAAAQTERAWQESQK